MMYNKGKEEEKMAIFDKLFKKTVQNVENPTETAEKLEPELDDPLLKALIQNEAITREKALMVPAVSSAVDFIANSIACMPVKLCKRKNGRVEVVEKDSRVRLLNGDTGDTLTSNQMKRIMVVDYLLDKGGYAYVERRLNEVTALHYVEPIYVIPFKNVDPIYKYVRYQVGDYYLRNWELIRLLRNTKDGATGKGLVKEVEKALQAAYATMLFQLRQVNTGGGKRGFLKAESKVSDDALRKIKDAFARMYGGSDSDNVVVLNKGLDFQEATSNSVELQLNQTLKTLDDSIAKIFHISSDFNTTYKEAIFPVVKAFEAALNSSLLTELEKKKDFYFEFDVKEIIKASIKERFEAYKLAKDTGLMTINELRAWESMNHIEGLDIIALSLGNVLYDTNTHEYYAPNTSVRTDLQGNTTQMTPNETGDKESAEEAQQEDASEPGTEKNNEGEKK